MTKIISIHSFRGGTGKSNTTANLAAYAASTGRRVGVIDTDIQSPGIHVLFTVDQSEMKLCLNDFLWDRCEIEDAVYEVSDRLGAPVDGRLFLIPSSIQTGEITRVLRDGYEVSRLNDGLQRAIAKLKLDVLFIDTHPGLNEETLLSIAISDVLIILLRPDHQDYQGTSVTVEVARSLEVPRVLLVVNKMPGHFDKLDIRERVETTYGCKVGAVIEHNDDLMTLGSGGVFMTRYPSHPLSAVYRELGATILG